MNTLLNLIRISNAAIVYALISPYLSAHDTFLRPETHHIQENEALTIFVFSGTFEQSIFGATESYKEHLIDLSPAGIAEVEDYTWEVPDVGSSLWRRWQQLRTTLGKMDLRNASVITIPPLSPGSHVIGFESGYRRAALDPAKFQDYLRLEARSDIDVEALGFDEPN